MAGRPRSLSDRRCRARDRRLPHGHRRPLLAPGRGPRRPAAARGRRPGGAANRPAALAPRRPGDAGPGVGAAPRQPSPGPVAPPPRRRPGTAHRPAVRRLRAGERGRAPAAGDPAGGHPHPGGPRAAAAVGGGDLATGERRGGRDRARLLLAVGPGGALARAAEGEAFRDELMEETNVAQPHPRAPAACGRPAAHHRHRPGGDRQADGLPSEFSFSRAFKRAFGVAPGAYRGRR